MIQDLFVYKPTSSSMTTIQLTTTSVNNSFISTVDHLPCDVIRSLWFIQSCNIRISKEKKDLDLILRNLSSNPPKEVEEHKEAINNLVKIRTKIKRYTAESIQESRALNNQLITHKLCLHEELSQLQQVVESKISNANDDSREKEELEKKLREHYHKNPLTSQLEAIQEQKELKVKPKSTGLKLVLKVPHMQKSKLSKKSSSNKVILNPKKVPKVSKLPLKKGVNVQPKFIEEEIIPVVEDTNKYCFCKQPSFGDMIGCDNEDSCPNGDWFHYKCVGLLNRVEALKFATGKQKWFCSDGCRKAVEEKEERKKDMKKKKKKRKW